jgi:hypothetical protein
MEMRNLKIDSLARYKKSSHTSYNGKPPNSQAVVFE